MFQKVGMPGNLFLEFWFIVLSNLGSQPLQPRKKEAGLLLQLLADLDVMMLVLGAQNARVVGSRRLQPEGFNLGRRSGESRKCTLDIAVYQAKGTLETTKGSGSQICE